LTFWFTGDARAQTIFATQFSEEAEEAIGETEKNVSGEDIATLLMRSARIRVESAEEATEGHLLVVFFGQEGELLHTVATDPLKLELEPPFIELADVMPGDRVVEGFERTLGEARFRIGGVKTWEPPPIMDIIEKREGAWEPPPIMLESGDVNPEIANVLWSEVREAGVSVAFVPTLGRYSEGDEMDVRVHPAMITGTLGE
jgi:hypothetical protein